jgi:dihydrofolate reductase
MIMSRVVRANLVLTLDGRYHGPGGAGDLAAVVPYAVTDVARDFLTGIWQGATTVVLSRGNAQGFVGYWSAVAEDDSADPRDRGYARWLLDTEKVVFSRTWTAPPWERTTVVSGPAAPIVSALASSGEGAILVNTSPLITKELLAADLVDELHLEITPEVTGGGERLFEDGIPATRWTLTNHAVGASGELALVYTRAR